MNIQEHIDRLKKLAEELGDELRKDMVLLGGMLVPFYITEANEELPRPTKDTDLIVPEMSYADFIETYDKQMREHGFRQGDGEDPICRWRKDDLIVDLLMVNSPQMGIIHGMKPPYKAQHPSTLMAPYHGERSHQHTC